MTELENDFEEIASQINRKLKEATIALKEVNRLKAQAGLNSIVLSNWEREAIEAAANQLFDEVEDKNDQERLVEEHIEEQEAKYELIDLSELEEQLDAAGWQTSSSYC